uniref:Uncharacterized protein n=1 Tax=Helianthus annuus TaxID=4232 RepID=A0A251TIS0_HELAN
MIKVPLDHPKVEIINVGIIDPRNIWVEYREEVLIVVYPHVPLKLDGQIPKVWELAVESQFLNAQQKYCKKDTSRLLQNRRPNRTYNKLQFEIPPLIPI